MSELLDGDVAVIGTGTMGSMTLWRLAGRGARAVGFEQFTPGHDRGAAGGETRIFRTAYLEGPWYVPLLQDARALWQELEHESGRQLLWLNGVLMVGPAESPEMRNVTASIDAHGLRHEVLSGSEVCERYPQLRVQPGDAAVLDLDAGYLRPELALVSAAACAERAGAEVCRYTTVTAVEPDGQGVVVRTGDGAYRFRAAVVAAGGWTGPLLPGLRSVVTVKRPIQAWFVARHQEWFAADTAPVLTRARDPQFYVLPSVDGAGVKVGLSTDGHEVVPNPDALDRTVSLEDVGRFRDVVTQFLPDLVPDPIRLGAYQEGYTADGHALVGRVPGAPQVVLLAGFSGHGFKLSPIIGDVAADLALEGSTERSIGPLDPARYLDGWPG